MIAARCRQRGFADGLIAEAAEEPLRSSPRLLSTNKSILPLSL